MAEQEITGFVNEDEDGSWGGYCTTPNCGGGSAAFSTREWPTEAVAADRIHQHLREHATGELMQSLEDFRADHDLVVNDEGRAVPEAPEGAKTVTFEGSDE
jgi:hypothetical protein